MRFLTVLLLLSTCFYASTLAGPRMRSLPSGFVYYVLSNQLHALEGAVKTQNKVIFTKIYDAGANDEKVIEEAMNHWKGYRFKARKAAFSVGTINQIIGQYQIETPLKEKDNSIYPITLVRDSLSPTGWKIKRMG
ncbi:hypothetical protein CAEBREN_05280 [Caenorhabditis brenneri]|uniref:Uncharacterized protein n=1 Tax=Caenorhabditis brenneri TaxID=135651 RepID=G0NQI5_CAEBE|nr:hypothetical protein CAEBREN_05280 [Caenorhabditis brenneri]